jgi:hypothetical protein
MSGRAGQILRLSCLLCLIRCAPSCGDSWQVASPGFADTDYKIVATLASSPSSAYVSSKRPVHSTHYRASLVVDPRSIAMPENGKDSGKEAA